MPEPRYSSSAPGCSKDCGYPLGPEVKADLENFAESLNPETSLKDGAGNLEKQPLKIGWLECNDGVSNISASSLTLRLAV